MTVQGSKPRGRKPRSFIIDEEGDREGLFGVFEDDGETGYLYIYDEPAEAVLRDLHIYDRSPRVQVKSKDVRVVWSDDWNKCGVIIWGKMHGIIDLKTERPGRVWLDSQDAPGIVDPEWLRGFES